MQIDYCSIYYGKSIVGTPWIIVDFNSNLLWILIVKLSLTEKSDELALRGKMIFS